LSTLWLVRNCVKRRKASVYSSSRWSAATRLGFGVFLERNLNYMRASIRGREELAEGVQTAFVIPNEERGWACRRCSDHGLADHTPQLSGQRWIHAEAEQLRQVLGASDLVGRDLCDRSRLREPLVPPLRLLFLIAAFCRLAKSLSHSKHIGWLVGAVGIEPTPLTVLSTLASVDQRNLAAQRSQIGLRITKQKLSQGLVIKRGQIMQICAKYLTQRKFR
jgi:hypothetical protein